MFTEIHVGLSAKCILVIWLMLMTSGIVTFLWQLSRCVHY